MEITQSTNTILMVRPANFGFNPETAENNTFQSSETDLSPNQIAAKAMNEFDNMVEKLRSEGVEVIVVEDTSEPVKTDAVFPNNWFSTHRDGTLFIYPMYSPNRRMERRSDVTLSLSQQYGYEVDDFLLANEEEGAFLEGTGSMILDRPNRIVYACYSERTDAQLLHQYCKRIDYDLVGFTSTDVNGIPIYHTNVMMTLGTHIAIICLDSIENEVERSIVISKLEETGKQIITLSQAQISSFAGNMLEVVNNHDELLLVMSTSAFNALTEEQLNIIKNHNKIVHLPISTIEKFGGGSARCMIAEIFKSDLIRNNH